MVQARVTLFEGRDEWVNIAVPMVFLVAALVFWAEGFSEIYNGIPCRVLANVFLLNVTHNAFTYFLLFSLPEVSSVLKQMNQQEKTVEAVRCGVIFFAIAVAALLFTFGPTPVSNPMNISGMIILLVNFLSLHHTVRQVFGISTAYDQVARSQIAWTDATKQRFERSVRIEKSLSWVLIPVFSMPIFFGIFNNVTVNVFIFAAEIAALTILLANSYFLMPGGNRSNKTLFLSRLLLYPMGLYSMTAFYGILAMHGIEYWYVWKKMVGRSQFRFTWKSKSAFIVLVVAVAAFSLLSPTRGTALGLVDRVIPGYMTLLKFLGAVSLGGSLLHYYLDRLLFRMKDPRIRQHIGPLLMNDPIPRVHSEIETRAAG